MPVADTLVGVIAPSTNVIAGVDEGFATVPLIPFAISIDTDVTLPADAVVQEVDVPFVVNIFPLLPV